MIDLIDELHCKLFLSEIVTCFYNKSDQFPSLKLPIRRIVSNSFLLDFSSFFEHYIPWSFKFLLFGFLDRCNHRPITWNTHFSFKITNVGLVMIVIHDIVLTVTDNFNQSSVLVHVFLSFIDERQSWLDLHMIRLFILFNFFSLSERHFIWIFIIYFFLLFIIDWHHWWNSRFNFIVRCSSVSSFV